MKPRACKLKFPFRRHKTQMEILYPGAFGKELYRRDGQIAKLYRKDISIDSIADRMELGVSTVCTRIKLMGLPLRRQSSMDKGG